MLHILRYLKFSLRRTRNESPSLRGANVPLHLLFYQEHPGQHATLPFVLVENLLGEIFQLDNFSSLQTPIFSCFPWSKINHFVGKNLVNQNLGFLISSPYEIWSTKTFSLIKKNPIVIMQLDEKKVVMLCY